MSTPEEQQQQQQQYYQQQQQQQQQDPYGTQTWQSETWDTAHQPAAPEGWFRDEAQQAPAQAPAPVQGWGETAYLPPYPGPAEPQQYQQTAAPDGWFREEAPAPAPVQEWGETAYLPPYPGPAEPYVEQPPQPQQYQQTAAPDGWFREEAPAPAPAPAQDWATAYLPPQTAAPATPVAAEPPEAAAAAAAAAEGAGEEPAYSPPTLAGNTLRAVDPAQARAEGRSPIIDPGPQPAILTAALGLLIAAAAAFGQLALLVPLITLQGLTAAGWFRLNGMWPARQGIALAFAGALAADAAVLAVDRAYGPGAIVGTLGAWVLLTLVLQLRSRAEPDERMYGLMASVASAALAIVCAGYLAADTAWVTVGAAAVAVAVFARALPLPTGPSVGVSLAAAAGAGVAVGGLTSVGAGGALLGLVAGACALIGLRVAAYDYPSKFVHMTAGVALPLAVAAPAVYLLGRVVG
ncbi:hypothetical protein [Streptomyces sp. NPDC060031]|uniref:hypothetical protein n=1 Tax=Streptomyces sp. NPDC060031 TaxID=3347043 RepID=UPI0036C561D7